MENQPEAFNNSNLSVTFDVEDQRIISLSKFIFLTIISLGLYELWWIYKAWRFFQQKDNLNVTPAARAIFSIIFLHSLLTKILDYSRAKGYSENYSPTVLFVGFIVGSFLGFLPDPFWLVSLFTFILLIPAFNALNFAKQNSTEFVVTYQTSYSGRQIALVIVGVMLWVIVLIGLSNAMNKGVNFDYY